VDQGVTLPDYGWSASAGDVNGDGLADLVLRNLQHEAHLYLGGKAWDSGPTLVVMGMPADFSADSVSVVGDVNGDGFADLAVGDFGRVVAGKDVGAVDLFLGGAVPDARADQTFVGARAGGALGLTLAWLVPR
jgi:hypothetical protein